MKYYAFYGIFINASTRDQVFGKDHNEFVELVYVDGYEANYDAGVARVREAPNGFLPLHICRLSPEAEMIADQVEGIERGLYYRSNVEQVFRDDWPGTEAQLDPSDITIYMLSKWIVR